MYRIRKMTGDDWPSVERIYEEGIIQGMSTFNTEVPSWEKWDEEHIKECRFVAVDCSRVVGWIALSPVSSRICYRGVAEVSVYVDREYRKQGIASTLLNYLCNEAEGAGYWSLYAAIFESNTASIDLHRKCGFRTIGYREKLAKDRFGRWQNSVAMERRLEVY